MKKFRDIKAIKINPEPAKGKNVDPGQLGQYSAKYQVSEGGSSLNQYLSSRGINPNFVSTATKIAHSKSSQFLKWQKDHMRNLRIEETDKKDMICMDIPLLIRVLEFTREDMKSDIQLHNMVERLINMRDNVPLDMTHYDAITSNLVKEEIEHLNEDETLKAIANKHGMKYHPGTYGANMSHPKKGYVNINRYGEWGHYTQGRFDRGHGLATAHGDSSKHFKDLDKHLSSLKEEVLDEASLHGNRKISPDEEKVIHKKTLKMVKHSLAGYLGDSKSENHHFPKAVEIHADLQKNHGKKYADHALHASLEAQRIQKVPSWIKEEVLDEAKKPKTTALEKWRKAATERENKHNQTKTKGMEDAITKLSQHLNKEEVELDEMINEVLSKDASAGDWIHDFVHSKNPKFAGKSTAERKKMALGAYYGKQNEEFEQLDELKKSTVFSWLKQQPVVPEKKPGMDKKAHNKRIKTHNKSWNSALDRLSGYKPTSEDMWQDTQAATQTPADGANGGNQVADRKRQMSKSARMIKALYKKHRVVKEDMYDHEKEDKSVATYGKKPKMDQTDKKDSFGENKPQAAATLSGGTTLTGVKRDSIEIDPLMRNRPGQPDISKKSGKKEDNKNDK
jgi:hypothetical protein